MEVSKPDFGNRVPIDAYGDGGFRISGDFHKGSLVILGSDLEPIAAQGPHDLSEDHLESLIAQKSELDFVLIGCGGDIQPLPARIRGLLDREGMPFDLMDTGAACRTYNVLIAEGRAFGALLLAVD